ncbi:MAG TPA: hypothetical protein VFH73_00715, partial [Polyangia bacterium]|nr:hypothetical protein [Polyangia bacterium]
MRSPTGFEHPVVKVAQGTAGLFALTVMASGACAPFSPTPPFHFAETAQVLAPREVGVTVAAGGGSFSWSDGVGGGARVRVGVGHHQEIGGEVTGMHVIDDSSPTPEAPWKGPNTAFAGKLSWKLAPLRWFAVSAAGGASHSATGTAAGGDVAVMFSTREAFWSRVRPYGGVRGALAIPVGRDSNEAGGVTEGLVVAVGTAVELDRQFKLLFEL